jgi:hypothetical protein
MTYMQAFAIFRLDFNHSTKLFHDVELKVCCVCARIQEILPDEQLPASEFELKGTRYDGQIAVLGKTMHEKLINLKYFLVCHQL